MPTTLVSNRDAGYVPAACAKLMRQWRRGARRSRPGGAVERSTPGRAGLPWWCSVSTASDLRGCDTITGVWPKVVTLWACVLSLAW